jgi:hypothetical protein
MNTSFIPINHVRRFPLIVQIVALARSATRRLLDAPTKQASYQRSLTPLSFFSAGEQLSQLREIAHPMAKEYRSN